MRPLFIVFTDKFLCGSAHLIQAVENIQIQHLFTECAVETLHIGILGRLAGLDEVQGNAVLLSPGRHHCSDKLRAIVHS